MLGRCADSDEVCTCLLPAERHADIAAMGAVDPGHVAIGGHVQAIEQPSFFLTGEADGLNAVRNPTEDSLRETAPGLQGFIATAGVGHWPQLEAPDRFNAALLQFLRSVTPR